jgi:HSP20 family molecular chaperone IbpA
MDAQYANGLLTLLLKKLQSAAPKRIAIKTGV